MRKLSLASTLIIINSSVSLGVGITTEYLLIYKLHASVLSSTTFSTIAMLITTQLIECLFIALSALIAKMFILKTAIDNYRLQNRNTETKAHDVEALRADTDYVTELSSLMTLTPHRAKI